jgi:hypothetical protein
MVLVILLIYQLIREKETQVKAERQYGEALQREQTERIGATSEMNRTYAELLRQTVAEITAIKGEMHALKGRIHEFVLGSDSRAQRGGGND